MLKDTWCNALLGNGSTPWWNSPCCSSINLVRLILFSVTERLLGYGQASLAMQGVPVDIYVGSMLWKSFKPVRHWLALIASNCLIVDKEAFPSWTCQSLGIYFSTIPSSIFPPSLQPTCWRVAWHADMPGAKISETAKHLAELVGTGVPNLASMPNTSQHHWYPV